MPPVMHDTQWSRFLWADVSVKFSQQARVLCSNTLQKLSIDCISCFVDRVCLLAVEDASGHLRRIVMLVSLVSETCTNNQR